MAEIVHDFFPLMRVYKDGRIERLAGEVFVPPESDPETGVQIKDVQIDPEINLISKTLPAQKYRSSSENSPFRLLSRRRLCNPICYFADISQTSKHGSS